MKNHCQDRISLTSLEIIDYSDETELKFNFNNIQVELVSKIYHDLKKTILSNYKTISSYKKLNSEDTYSLVVILIIGVVITFLQFYIMNIIYKNEIYIENTMLFIFTSILSFGIFAIYMAKNIFDTNDKIKGVQEAITECNNIVNKIESYFYTLSYCEKNHQIFDKNGHSLQLYNYDEIDKLIKKSDIIKTQLK